MYTDERKEVRGCTPRPAQRTQRPEEGNLREEKSQGENKARARGVMRKSHTQGAVITPVHWEEGGFEGGEGRAGCGHSCEGRVRWTSEASGWPLREEAWQRLRSMRGPRRRRRRAGRSGVYCGRASTLMMTTPRATGADVWEEERTRLEGEKGEMFGENGKAIVKMRRKGRRDVGG